MPESYKHAALDLYKLPRNEALRLLDEWNPVSIEERVYKCHCTEVIHNALGSEKNDLDHFRLALDAALEGVDLATRNGIESETVAKMAVNCITDSGHLKIDIRDRFPYFRRIVVACGTREIRTWTWWNVCFYYHVNLHVLDTAVACLEEYRRSEGHDPEEARHMAACLDAFRGKGISELTRLKSRAAHDLVELVENNLRFITGPDFKPAATKDLRSYSQRGQKSLEFVLNKQMDALSLALDVLDDCGDARLACAVECLRQCNDVLDQALKAKAIVER